MPFEREAFFDSVRQAPFGGALTQQQVDGMGAILDRWEAGREPLDEDHRFLAYELATTKHETASTMWPIEEYGKGQGQPYGVPDPETGQTYYGRGFVQLTWRENYRNMTKALELDAEHDLEWHAEHALDLDIAAQVMFEGMTAGSFRPPHKLADYFTAAKTDAFNARDIINGDKHLVPSWSDGKPIGKVIAVYFDDFLAALELSYCETPVPAPKPPAAEYAVQIYVTAPPNVTVCVKILSSEK